MCAPRDTSWACMPPRHTPPQTCTPLGMHALQAHMPRGHACSPGHTCPPRRACPPGRYYEMHSMSGQYASYWNAFLLLVKMKIQCISSYRPQTKLWEGNIFTPVCQSFCSQGEGVVHPPRQIPPWEETPQA